MLAVHRARAVHRRPGRRHRARAGGRGGRRELRGARGSGDRADHRRARRGPGALEARAAARRPVRHAGGGPQHRRRGRPRCRRGSTPPSPPRSPRPGHRPGGAVRRHRYRRGDRLAPARHGLLGHGGHRRRAGRRGPRRAGLVRRGPRHRAGRPLRGVGAGPARAGPDRRPSRGQLPVLALEVGTSAAGHTRRGVAHRPRGHPACAPRGGLRRGRHPVGHRPDRPGGRHRAAERAAAAGGAGGRRPDQRGRWRRAGRGRLHRGGPAGAAAPGGAAGLPAGGAAAAGQREQSGGRRRRRDRGGIRGGARPARGQPGGGRRPHRDRADGGERPRRGCRGRRRGRGARGAPTPVIDVQLVRPTTVERMALPGVPEDRFLVSVDDPAIAARALGWRPPPGVAGPAAGAGRRTVGRRRARGARGVVDAVLVRAPEGDWLRPVEVDALCRAAGLPTVPTAWAPTAEEAAAAVARAGARWP